MKRPAAKTPPAKLKPEKKIKTTVAADKGKGEKVEGTEGEGPPKTSMDPKAKAKAKSKVKVTPEDGAEQEVEEVKANTISKRTSKGTKKDEKTDKTEMERDEKKNEVDGEKPKKQKAEPKTFARRNCPTNEFGAAKFLAIRSAFKSVIHPHLSVYSAHEELVNMFVGSLEILIFGKKNGLRIEFGTDYLVLQIWA